LINVLKVAGSKDPADSASQLRVSQTIGVLKALGKGDGHNQGAEQGSTQHLGRKVRVHVEV
jgi:hypothetical protein